MKKLYCFDFDGTLTKKDTMFLFLKFYNAKKFRTQLLKHLPVFVFLKLKLMEAEKVKQSFISGVLQGESRADLEAAGKAFFETNYPQLVRENALDFISNIDRKHTESLLVTASLDIWAKPFAEKFGFKLVSTKAEFVDEKFTGKFATPNCNGSEKLRRIKEEIGQKTYDKIIAFGDTEGDRAMLNWAHESHFAFFE